MKTALSKPYIQNPDRWDVYERPADNLLFAILMRAVNDSLGFYDANHGTYDNGDSAIEWLHTEGKRIYTHLLTAPKNPKDNQYEKDNNIVHSRCYTEYGLKRTGCAGCPFGQNYKEELQIIQKYEPKLFKACIYIFGDSYMATNHYLKMR